MRGEPRRTAGDGGGLQWLADARQRGWEERNETEEEGKR